MQERSYPAKLLLFGEYAVVCGGEGLAIPYYRFSAKLIFDNTRESEYKMHLQNFLFYLQANDFTNINLNVLQNDLENGLDFQSNIPIGYGVGSSGAVVAAIYDRYSSNKSEEKNLKYLKSSLAGMEDFFHKKSSGLDPLVCYLNKSIHVKQNEELELIQNLPILKNISFELHDSGVSRSTSKFVEIFKNKLQNEEYQKKIYQEYLHLNADCIKHYLESNEVLLIQNLRKLSEFQYTHFDFAIPDSIRSTWLHALNSGEKIYKLCGAGGGGFTICFSLNN